MSPSATFSMSPVKASNVIGTKVVNARDESLGDIKELVIEPRTGRLVYAVVAFGGFLGLGEKLFAIPFGAFAYNADKNAYVLNVPQERLKDAPGFDAAHWPAMDEKWSRELHIYYDSAPYWE